MIARMTRTLFGGALLAVAAFATLPAQTNKAAKAPFTSVEATIPEMRAALEQGRVTSHEIVRQDLVRIATYEDRLHAAITVNPRALPSVRTA